MNTHFTPVPFDPVNDALVLSALGYRREFVPAQWMDVGGPESGPKLVGHDAYEAWTRGNHCFIVYNGELVDEDFDFPEPGFEIEEFKL